MAKKRLNGKPLAAFEWEGRTYASVADAVRDNPTIPYPRMYYYKWHGITSLEQVQHGTPPQVQSAIIAAIASGKTQAQVASEYGVHQTTVWAIVNGYPKEAKPPRITDEIRQAVIEANERRESQVDIAREFGISQPTVSRILRAAKLAQVE